MPQRHLNPHNKVMSWASTWNCSPRLEKQPFPEHTGCAWTLFAFLTSSFRTSSSHKACPVLLFWKVLVRTILILGFYPSRAAALQAELASVLAGSPSTSASALVPCAQRLKYTKKGEKERVQKASHTWWSSFHLWRASPSKFGFEVVLSILTASSHNCSSICGVGRADASSVSSKKSLELARGVQNFLLRHF